MYDVVIIGAGIVGTAIARELSRYKTKVIVLDKEQDVANGTTMANSAIVHSGYDPKPGTNKAKFNKLGNQLYPQLCKELDVPFKQIGSLTVALDKEELKILDQLEERAKENGVPVERLSREEVLVREPNVNKNVQGALLASTAGIVGPWELSIALMENAMNNGVELALNNKVEDIKKVENIYRIKTNEKTYETKVVINCAGLYADHINRMLNKDTFHIKPRSGEYFVLDKRAGNLVNSIIFPCPTKHSKGILAVPTVHGNILLGPTSELVEDKEALQTTRKGLEYVKAQVGRLINNIPYGDIIRSFTGLRATPDTGDFIIESSKDNKTFIHVAGIESPGLTAAPAIALEVVNLVKEIFNSLEKNENFEPNRRKVVHFNQLSMDEKKKIIKENPAYGNIICRCERITEGEILDCIHRKAGATTVKGVKKRARPGMGRCQGGFCEPRVVEILARELNKDMKDILYDGRDAKILLGYTKE
ncbi:FAD-dependent oxidoreductase [Irregularibacter muris]|uniref:FAD-dependent oxidoreductase n=1 Tax=Irregularibacter muris TaxID=1796619 RepID=A0AAE3HCA5_9FIRM|nr:NAD(P)/FAD-dependent oxidoreductase [Irregularibacter muris]MCR1897567.1 FAD-dependent oxidoreductase [Irregularibacter muris]